jgi:hypothetical protein
LIQGTAFHVSDCGKTCAGLSESNLPSATPSRLEIGTTLLLATITLGNRLMTQGSAKEMIDIIKDRPSFRNQGPIQAKHPAGIACLPRA